MQDGDTITIDAEARRIDLEVPAEEIAARLAEWKQPAPRYTRGVLAKYARVVSPASRGAVTDALKKDALFVGQAPKAD